MTTVKAAFHWWNAATGNEEDLDFVPICPYPREVIPIWRNQFIEFIYEIDAFQLKTPNDYWHAITSVLQQYYPNGIIPDPITDFSSFVNLLYLLKYILKPQSIESVVSLINGYQKSTQNFFFLFKAPVVIEDPMLYLNAIDYMHESGAKFWVDFSKNKEFNDFFIGFYITLILPTKSKDDIVWEYRLLLVRIVFNQISILPRSHENFTDYCLTLLEKITDCVKNCTDEASINLVRYFISTVKLIGKKCQLETMRNHVNGLYEALPPDAAGFNYAYQYSQTMFGRSQHMTGQKLLLGIKKRKLESPRDFLLMSNLINKSHNSSVLALIAKTALSASYWFRTGMKMILDIAKRPKRGAEIDEWLSIFFRRLLVFIILSSATGKYVGRAVMICEFLEEAQGAEISKSLKILIKRGAASVLEHPSCPSFFAFFVKGGSKSDTKTTQEINGFLKSNLRNILKTFPFMKARPLFVVPAGKKNDGLSYRSAPAKVKSSKKPKKSPLSKAKALKPYAANARPDISTKEDMKLLDMLAERSQSPHMQKSRNSSDKSNKSSGLSKSEKVPERGSNTKFSISFSVRNMDFGMPGNLGLLEAGHLAQSNVYLDPPPITKEQPKKKRNSSVDMDRDAKRAQKLAAIEMQKALSTKASNLLRPIRTRKKNSSSETNALTEKHSEENEAKRRRHKSSARSCPDQNDNNSIKVITEEKKEKHKKRRHRTEAKPVSQEVLLMSEERDRKKRSHRNRSENEESDRRSSQNSEKLLGLHRSSSSIQYQTATLPSLLQNLVPDSPLHSPRPRVQKEPVKQVPAPSFKPTLPQQRARIVSADVESLIPSSIFSSVSRRTEDIVRTYRDRYLAEEEIHPIARAIPMTFHLKTSSPATPRRTSRSEESDSDGSNIMMGRLIADGVLE